MAAAILLLFVVLLSLIITRIAATALVLTGLSRDTARFQARSAFTGVGFTTKESESIADHPVRRRIVMLLMLLGNAGIVTVVATSIAALTGRPQAPIPGATHQLVDREIAESSATQQLVPRPDSQLSKILVLVMGLLALFIFSRSKVIDRQMSGVIEWALRNWTDLDVNDYVALLQLSKGYTVVETHVSEGDWLADSQLARLSLPQEGVLVLGVRRRDGSYIGAPTGVTEIKSGDSLTLYGKMERLQELNNRRLGVAGVYARKAAIDQHQKEIEAELTEAQRREDHSPSSE